VESSKKSYTDVSIRIWIGDSFVSPVSTPSKISIQNPILVAELGNQRKNNLDSRKWKEKSKARQEVLHGLF